MLLSGMLLVMFLAYKRIYQDRKVRSPKFHIILSVNSVFGTLFVGFHLNDETEGKKEMKLGLQ